MSHDSEPAQRRRAISKPTFAPGLRVSRRVKLWDNPDAPQPGKLDDHPNVGGRVHVGVRVVGALLAQVNKQ